MSEPSAAFSLSSSQQCGKCHVDRAQQYRATYHGKAQELGIVGVATCFDCHQAHAIYPSTDPKSSLAPTRRPVTCRKCHQGASDGFATIYAHADPDDTAHYPRLHGIRQAMMGLLFGLLGLAALHTVLWFGRSAREALRDAAAWRRQRRSLVLTPEQPTLLRFRAIDRFCHGLLAAGFLVLVATGMPLKFHEMAWAQALFEALGGARVTGGLHRMAAALTLLAAAVHGVSMVRLLMRQQDLAGSEGGIGRWRKLVRVLFGPDAPLPNPRDLRDAWHHVRWFLRGGQRPDFDRFTYWEKFDYVVAGGSVAIMGITGLIQWFPQATTVFLPGWVVNFAQLLHSDEALIAAGLILLVHSFNVHFRPDRFPLDSVMFSGRVTEEQVRIERPRLYARLQDTARLDATRGEDDWRSWKPIVSLLGLLALFIGIALAIAIFSGLGSVLFG